MELTLPPVMYRGRIQRVHSPNCVEVLLDLRFGVRIERGVLLEGVDIASIPPALREEAKYCLILLLAKRNVLIQTDDAQKDGQIVGRMFLAEDVKDPPVALQCPYRVDTPMLEVTGFYQWLAQHNYDASYAAKLYGNNLPPRVKSRKVS